MYNIRSHEGWCKDVLQLQFRDSRVWLVSPMFPLQSSKYLVSRCDPPKRGYRIYLDLAHQNMFPNFNWDSLDSQPTPGNSCIFDTQIPQIRTIRKSCDSTNRIKKRAVPWPLAIHHDTLQQSIQNDVPTILEAAFTDASDQSSLYYTQTLNGAGIFTEISQKLSIHLGKYTSPRWVFGQSFFWRGTVE